MGTTAEKLKYLNETKAEIKNALETPYNVMRDYPELIKKYIDNQPTKVVTDGICGNAVDVPVKTIETNGNIRQETTEGYQLLNLQSGMQNGITYYVDDEGYFYISGTCTSDRITLNLNEMVLNGTYTFTSKSISGGGINCVLKDNTSEYKNIFWANNNNNTKEVNAISKDLVCYLTNGATYNSKIKLMLVSGSQEKDVEPYTGGISSPNPDYPQEIETINSIGLEQSGKNKFDNFKEYSYSNSNLNTTSINNGIKIEKKGGFGLWVFDNLENLDGKIVRAKSKFNDGGSIAIGLASLNGTSRTVMKENTKSNTVSSFVIPKITDDKKYLAVWLYGLDNSEISYEDLIITIDNEDITYEPYHEPKVITIDLQGNTLGKVGDVKDILKVNRNGEVKIKKNTWEETINSSDLVTLPNNNKGLVFYTSKKKTTSYSDNDYLVTNAQRNRTFNDGTIYQNHSNFVFVGSPTDTLETIKAKFNGGKILYQLATPQIITLPSISPIELWQGTNIFSLVTNLDTDFEVEYVVDKDSVTKEEE